VDAIVGFRARQVLVGERALEIEVDAVEHRVLVIHRHPDVGRRRIRGDDLVERHQHDIGGPERAVLAMSRPEPATKPKSVGTTS